MSRGLPILTYHAIDHSGSVIATDPVGFAATMSAFHQAGYRTLDLDDWIAQGRPDLDRAFAICFDDGLRSILPAADVLARFGFTATVFLVTDRMGRDNAWPGQPWGIPRQPLLTWSDTIQLQAAGFRFGAHTRTHPRLDRLDEAAIRDELLGSRKAIEQRLGQPCRLLAYPYGVDSPCVRLVATHHFAAAFGTNLGRASVRDDPHALPRIDAYELRSPRAVAALLRGLEGPRFRVRQAMRATRRATLGRLASAA